MFLCFAIIVIVYCITRIITQRKNEPTFPSPPKLVFLKTILRSRSSTHMLSALDELDKISGPTYWLHAGPFAKGIITADPKFVEFLLSSNTILTKSDNYKFLSNWLGSGLLLADGNKWRRHRKIIAPAFHLEILKEFVQTFESVGDILVNTLADNEDSSSLDVYPLITLATLDIICETAMGICIGAQTDQHSEYVSTVKGMCQLITERSLSFWKIINFIYRLTDDYNKQEKFLKILHKYSSDVIVSRMKEAENIFPVDGRKMAFLDHILTFNRKNQQMTLEQVREEVDTFMFEGHDTTASGISFALYCLANNSEVQGKVYQEQKALFGDEKNPKISYQDLQNMKYLEMVIKETFRLYPPVPVIGRFTKEDFYFDGNFVPKNTNIAIYIHGMHKTCAYFENPQKFYPERFESGFQPFTYLPFSAGPRNCIGQKFAMLEMKSVLSKIVRNFILNPAESKHELVLSMEIVLKSKNGMKIGMRKRKN